MKKHIIAFMAGMVLALSAQASDNDVRLVVVKTVQVNGDEISLSITEDKNGLMCAQYIETVQFIAYGETAYTLGEHCQQKPPKLERT